MYCSLYDSYTARFAISQRTTQRSPEQQTRSKESSDDLRFPPTLSHHIRIMLTQTIGCKRFVVGVAGLFEFQNPSVLNRVLNEGYTVTVAVLHEAHPSAGVAHTVPRRLTYNEIP